MLRLKIIVVDKTRSPFLQKGESFYLSRVQRYTRVQWIEVKPTKMDSGRTEEEILDLEARAMGRKFAPGDYLVALDRSGDQLDSLGLAKWLERLSVRTGGWISFLIGGPLGLSRGVLDRAHETLSLSKLTLTHEMSRLILLEQLYRAFTILRGEKYHKE